MAWTTRRKLLLQLALIPVLLVGVELLFRGWLRSRGTPYDAAETARRIAAVADRVEQPLVAWNAGGATRPRPDGTLPVRVPSPTHGWDFDNVPGRLRYLQRYFASEEGEETYDVLIVGGSVAAGFLRDGSARLVERLAADPRLAGRPIETLGLARGGFKQPQQLNQVAYALALGIRPDAVINLDGFNEVALGNQNTGYGAHPLHPSIPHWGHLVVFGRADEAMLDGMLALTRAQQRARRLAEVSGRWTWSAVLGELLYSRAARARSDHVDGTVRYGAAVARRGQQLQLFGPGYDPDFEAVTERVVAGWSEASRSLDALCRAHGVHYVHALQPTLHDRGSKVLTEEEVRTSGAHESWLRSVPHAYPLLRAEGARLRAAGVAFVDGSMALKESRATLYYDACHFVAAGHELLADVIADGFLADLSE